MGQKDILNQLITLANHLGKPEYDLAILGEGNVSARADENSFYIKASGTQLQTIKEDGFVQVKFDVILALLDIDQPGEEDIKRVFEDARVDKSVKSRPSVETLMHAVCLNYEGINFIGHTHPTAVNKLTCSKSYPKNLMGRMYPDEMVVLGRDSVLLPYIDPGVVLAKAVKEGVNRYIEEYKENPKVVYLQNHGFIALGATSAEVGNITLTAKKAAEVRLGAMLSGGINLLSKEMVNHIIGRPDEVYRRNLMSK
jgi:rhamnose utilization protein RhaD (predicted bifunctional aldolase and dehydrogenase)